MKRISLLLLASTLMAVSSCKKDDMDDPQVENFTLTIENVFEPKDFFETGTTDGIAPGSSYTFTFNAGHGHYLSLATMLAQSNDLFYGFDDMGIALYDGSGTALTGDVSSMVYLWDAGTEVNEEPGVGLNQAPRQSAANTGTDENGTIRMIADVSDGFTYPSVADIIKITLEHDGGTMFSVTIENRSDLVPLTGPLAPGIWVVHSDAVQLYTENMAAPDGLEELSEDGNNSVLAGITMMSAGLVSPFAPGVFAVYSDLNPIFKSGMTASSALMALSEDGDPSGFSFMSDATVSDWGTFLVPVAGSGAAPIFPGDKYEVTFEASPGDELSFATMLVQSNDLFIAPAGLTLFMNETPVSGDITNQLKLWDAKTEVNEYPGAGMNQAPRQSGPDTGSSETGTVEEVSDGFTYPSISDIIKVTITLN